VPSAPVSAAAVSDTRSVMNGATRFDLVLDKAELRAQLHPVTKLTHEKGQRMLRRANPTGLRRTALVQRQRALNKAARAATKVLNRAEKRLALQRVECPICLWTGIAFRPFAGPGYLRWNATCPNCNSQERQRFFYVVWSTGKPARGRVLYFAPEQCLRALVDNGDQHVMTTDLFDPSVDFMADIERTPIRAESVTLCLCSDVLEHVEQDVVALREIRRVLKLDGIALVHVPVVIDRTLDFGMAIEGDYGHRRAYGTDVLDRMEEAGLAVGMVPALTLPEAVRHRFGIGARDALFVLARDEKILASWGNRSNDAHEGGRVEQDD
jgi:SAM-dependent methyltransferase